MKTTIAILILSSLGWTTHQMKARTQCVYSAESAVEWTQCSMPGALERGVQLAFSPITGM